MTKLSTEENKEYVCLRGIFCPTKDQLCRLNELRDKMGQKETGFFKMSETDKDAAIKKDKEEEKRRKEDYIKYKKSPKRIPGEREYDEECPSFGEE